MKRCGKCRDEKPFSEFHRGKGGYQHWCKACRRIYDREYHRRTRPLRLEQKKRWHASFRARYQDLKRGPCADCGRAFPPVVMTFDHRPGTTKLAEVAKLAQRRNRRLLMDEIAKCDLVCANCHALRSWVERRGT
jgi:hypothetical protein